MEFENTNVGVHGGDGNREMASTDATRIEMHGTKRHARSALLLGMYVRHTCSIFVVVVVVVPRRFRCFKMGTKRLYNTVFLRKL